MAIQLEAVKTFSRKIPAGRLNDWFGFYGINDIESKRKEYTELQERGFSLPFLDELRIKVEVERKNIAWETACDIFKRQG